MENKVFISPEIESVASHYRGLFGTIKWMLAFTGLGFGLVSNEIEKKAGFEFIKCEVKIETWNVNGEGDSSIVINFSAKQDLEIRKNDSSLFLTGIDSVVQEREDGVDDLCGCMGCGSWSTVTFFGLKKKELVVQYGGCGIDFEVATFKVRKKNYDVHYSPAQVVKITAAFKNMLRTGARNTDDYLKEIESKQEK
jgi:hypothetical protein